LFHHNLGGRAAVAGALVLAALGGVAVAQEAGPTGTPGAPMEGATVADAGWWNRLRPELALPTGQPPAPPVPGVPEGALVVGATAGDPDAIAAIGIEPDHDDGATVETFELLLREVEDDGATLGTTFAAVVACPVTGFWVGGENGVWETRPEYDCSLAEAPGVRAEDGNWTFDLRAIGQLWSDGTVANEGVALVEKVEPPTGFRVAYAGLADLGIGVRVVATGGEEVDDPFGGGGGFDTGSTGGRSDFGGGSAGGGTGFRPPSSSPSPRPSPATTPTTAAPAGDETAADVPLPSIPISGPGSPIGTLPWWTWPLALAALALGLLAMVALGPSGEPALAGTGRGITRAIDARTTSTSTDSEER
jgi:hypothetical protein